MLVPPPEKESTMALVRIVEGDVTAELLKAELERILPVKWDWVVRENGPKEFIVPFSGPVELKTLPLLKGFQLIIMRESSPLKNGCMRLNLSINFTRFGFWSTMYLMRSGLFFHYGPFGLL